MEISILRSKMILNIVECEIHSQTPFGIIRTTTDYFRAFKNHLKCDFQSNQLNYPKMISYQIKIAKILIDFKSKSNQIICISLLKIP
jgi:hypothetical protein